MSKPLQASKAITAAKPSIVKIASLGPYISVDSKGATTQEEPHEESPEGVAVMAAPSSVSDNKSVSLGAGASNVMRSLKVALSAKRGGKTKMKKLGNLKTRILITNTYTSAATTSQFPVQNVAFASASEASAFDQIYDEVRILGGTSHFQLAFNTAATTHNSDLLIAYDPIDNTALGSIASGIVYSQHMGPIRGGTGGSQSQCPTVVTKTGYFQFRFRVPPGPQEAPNVGSVVTGQWADCTAASGGTVSWGYLKFVVLAAVTGTTTLTVQTVLDVEFRNRGG